MSIKLNLRLQTLAEMVNEKYQLVWDGCCDHGLLGIKILSDGLVEQVNFVDRVPQIIKQLEQKLLRYQAQLPAGKKWKVLCQDVTCLSLPENKKQLFILSGVGGELMIEMLQILLSQNDHHDIDFLLCPVQHTYQLRQALVDLGLKLKKEQIVVENGRGYELLLVSQSALQAITLTGETQWQTNEQHQNYLKGLIKHYQRSVCTADANSTHQSALQAYQQCYAQYYQG